MRSGTNSLMQLSSMLAAHSERLQTSVSLFALTACSLGSQVVVKLVFSFFLSYPLAGVLKRIPDKAPWQKNAFIIA